MDGDASLPARERSSSNELPKAASLRTRTNGRACVGCHQRKVKCDILTKGAPCTNCSTQNRQGCEIFQKKKERAKIQFVDQTLVAIRPRLGGTSTPSEPVRTTRQNDARSKRRRRVSASSDSEDDADTDEHLKGNLCELVDNEELRSREIGLQGRMCYIGTDISTFNYLVRQSSIKPRHDGCFHFGSRQFNRKHTSHDLKHIPSEVLDRPDKVLASKLLRAYFVHVNRGWPIVDEENFMKQYEGKDICNPVPLPLMNAIFMVGAHILGSESEEMKKMQTVFFRRAKTLIDYRFEQDRMMYVQVALLMTWYSDGLEEIVANAWHWIGIATRTALGLGMHRDTTGSMLLPVSKRTWLRLWWVLFQFDTIVSASYGRPQAIHLDESDVPELEPRHFEGIPHAQADFVMQHTKLCMIISETTRKRWALRSSAASREEATRVGDETLAKFITSLPSSMRLQLPAVDPWQATLHLTYNNFLILLHRPPPKRALRDEVSDAVSDLTICGDAASTVTAILETLLGHDDLRQLWLYSCHTVFTVIAHVGNELDPGKNIANPLIDAKARSMFDSLMKSLRELSRHWKFASGLLYLFEHREMRLKYGIGCAVQRIPPPAQPRAPLGHVSDESNLSLHPGQQVHTNPFPMTMPPYPAPTTPGTALGLGLDGAPEQQYGQGFLPGEMYMNDMPFPEASALEFFLAGMDGIGLGFGFDHMPTAME